MTGRRTPGADDSRCPACTAPVLTQWAGTVAALRITADLTPLAPAEQAAVREPNRLIWCLYRASAHSPPRLRWATAGHPPGCGHPHVTEHRCPPAEPTTLF
ncbi:hypothetical protein [Streptomyces sp. NPDC094049]|uniref:hypothetical protein n=1 Tax=Streptomyces sp. NPDC094049 TaxID=3154987 RepID=UPI00332DA306